METDRSHGGTIAYHGAHNISIAIDSPAGLIVPNIKAVSTTFPTSPPSTLLGCCCYYPLLARVTTTVTAAVTATVTTTVTTTVNATVTAIVTTTVTAHTGATLVDI